VWFCGDDVLGEEYSEKGMASLTDVLTNSAVLLNCSPTDVKKELVFCGYDIRLGNIIERKA